MKRIKLNDGEHLYFHMKDVVLIVKQVTGSEVKWTIRLVTGEQFISRRPNFMDDFKLLEKETIC